MIDGSTDTVLANVNVGSSPQAVAVNPATNKVYVANGYYSTVTVIDVDALFGATRAKV